MAQVNFEANEAGRMAIKYAYQHNGFALSNLTKIMKKLAEDHPEDKMLFRRFQTVKKAIAVFATLTIVLPHIKNNPGVIQSDLYRTFPDIDRDELASVLYACDVYNGFLKRERYKGTYKIEWIGPDTYDKFRFSPNEHPATLKRSDFETALYGVDLNQKPPKKNSSASSIKCPACNKLVEEPFIECKNCGHIFTDQEIRRGIITSRIIGAALIFILITIVYSIYTIFVKF